MRGLNHFEIVGNVGSDPVMRYTQDGSAVVSFSVAVNETWKGKDGQKHENVVWVKVTLWRQLAETMNQYIKKGTSIFVSGKASVSAFQGRDGQPQASLELNGRDVLLLGGRAQESDEAADYSGGVSEPSGEIPF